MSSKLYHESSSHKMYTILAILAGLTSCLALYSPSSHVMQLTPKNFDNLVLKGDEVWIVEFFSPGCSNCQKFAPEYTKAALGLKGMIKVGAVDAHEHKDLRERYNVLHYPTIKIFGADKNKPQTYSGAMTSQGLFDAALVAAKAKLEANLKEPSAGRIEDTTDVVQLNDINFDSTVLQSQDVWLVEFYAPWCSHCKRLAPEWAKAASELKGKVKFGVIDATINLAQASKYGIEGYPTIKYFAAGEKDSASDYDGKRSASGIVAWSLSKLADDVAFPEIAQITDKKIFKKACQERPLCVVTILPHILDCQSECRNKHIETLKKLGEKFKNMTWGWVWSEAGSQMDLERTLDIGGFGYPALAVLNAKKMTFAVLQSAFSKGGADEFLKNITSGRIQTDNFKGKELPKIVKLEPWDGKDGQLPLSHGKPKQKEEL